MKKIFFLALLIAMTAKSAGAETTIIARDYYISGKRSVGENVIEVAGVLPNTLFVKISVGESAEIRADVVPEDAGGAKLLWSLPEGAGNVEISPDDRVCKILGKSSGDETIRVDSPDGAHALVRVRVSENVPPDIVLECDKKSISEGETAEIRAQTVPLGEGDIKWEIVRGKRNAELEPDKNVCRVRALRGGDVTVAAEYEGVKKEITLSVEKKATGIGIRTLVTVFSVCAVALLTASSILGIKRRRDK